LLALACVIRDPSRFNVTLPTLAAEDHLEAVDITPGMTLSATANHAGMLADDLRHLNPAMSKDALDSASGSQILMPHRNAEQWRNAMQSANAQDMTASNAPLTDTPSSKDAEVTQDSAPAAVKSHTVRTHTVKPGESLWQIAHKYSVSVNTLERLNNLHGKPLKPGQVLKLDTP
jgi:membrane-bound lytic murein transglycosylase D